MPDQEVIDGLIATVRELNHQFHSIDPAVLDTISVDEVSDDTVAGILLQMRNRELSASQAIKQMLLGESAAQSDEEATIISEVQRQAGTNVRVLLAQFGTAREATLSLVRDLPNSEWDRVFTTPRGEMSLRDYLKTLVERDRQRMSQIQSLLSKAHA